MAATRKPLTFDTNRSPPTSTEVSTRPAKPVHARQQVGARVSAITYRQLKARAALQGVAVGSLVEQAITEFLASHSDEA